MKTKVVAVSLALAMLVGAGSLLGQKKDQSQPPTTETTKLQLAQCALKVSGMTCDGCAKGVESGLLKVDGVKAAKVDFKSGEASVEYDPKKTSPEKVVAAFNENQRGYRVELAKSKGQAKQGNSEGKGCCP
jgi:copper chaperone CopZ